mmetsp:Transcript_1825/g.5823  ORF Transcript_1825/g.5823 Transcript_1825/m.5823 type:complete len:294 (-) Transcript_1825:8-889(-)
MRPPPPPPPIRLPPPPPPMRPLVLALTFAASSPSSSSIFARARALGPAGLFCNSFNAWIRVRNLKLSLSGKQNSGVHDGGGMILHTPYFSASGRIELMYSSGSPAHSSSVGRYVFTGGTSYASARSRIHVVRIGGPPRHFSHPSGSNEHVSHPNIGSPRSSCANGIAPSCTSNAKLALPGVTRRFFVGSISFSGGVDGVGDVARASPSPMPPLRASPATVFTANARSTARDDATLTSPMMSRVASPSTRSRSRPARARRRRSSPPHARDRSREYSCIYLSPLRRRLRLTACER